MMTSNKINITRITDLITQYAETNGVDNSFDILAGIVSNIKLNNCVTFKETALLAGILNVSPDYITGLTDKKDYDDNLLSLISTAVLLNDNMQEFLIDTAKNYKEIQDNSVNFNAAGVNVIVHNKNGKIISQSLEPGNNSLLFAADESEEYIKRIKS